jgi:ABC-type transport system involved in multi-copper enzyme maturation permease subunit
VRAGIIAVVAVSFAGELTARTLREDLVRPVSRGQVMAAKWGAVQVLVAVCALLPLAVALAVGGLLFPWADVREPLLGFALAWLGDVGFATLVVAISTLLRSVPGTIGGVFLYWVVDRVLGWVLWGVARFRGIFDQLFDAWKTPELKLAVDWVVAVRPWLPSSAFDVGFEQGFDAPLAWRSFVALAGYTVLAYLVASFAFRRIDVD